jgi:aspartate aminotransferase
VIAHQSPLVPWLQEEIAGGGWIRKMFTRGQELRAKHGADAVADLSLGQPLPPGDDVREAFERAASDRRAGRFGYMPNAGLPALRERCAAELGSDGVTPESITVTGGAAGAICVALHAFAPPGSRIVTQAPYFPEFPLYARTAGCTLTAVPATTDSGLDLERLEREIDADTGAVILNTPCNPSGHVATRDELQQLVRILERQPQRPVLLVDEVYHNFHYEPAQRVDPLALYDRTIIARSFSKDIGIAGERLGYLVLHPSMTGDDTRRGIDTCMRALGFVNGPATAQIAMTQLPSWRIDLEPYRRRRDLLVDGLRALGVEVASPDGAIYAWIKSPREDALEMIEALSEQRVLMTPGVAFGVPTHIRACFSVPTQTIEAAIAAFSSLR